MVFSEENGELLVTNELGWNASGAHGSTPYGTQSGTQPSVCTRSSQATASHKESSVYKQRWYILFVFVLLNTVQSTIGNTWGPLADSMKAAFYWNDGTIALQTNWGPISYVVAIVPGVWLMDVKGMRVACVFAGLLIAIGSALRCITLQVPTFTWLVHAGQIVSGVAGPVVYAGSPVLSACWFPANQRTTATSLAIMGSAFGMALSFILGPALVQDARYTYKRDNYTTPSVLVLSAAAGENTNASLASTPLNGNSFRQDWFLTLITTTILQNISQKFKKTFIQKYKVPMSLNMQPWSPSQNAHHITVMQPKW